jgi:hypothetical protein
VCVALAMFAGHTFVTSCSKLHPASLASSNLSAYGRHADDVFPQSHSYFVMLTCCRI